MILAGIVDQLARSKLRIVTLLRLGRERVLSLMYSRTGVLRTVNGTEVRVLPQYRALFSPRYDQQIAEFFRARVRPGDTCFSIGANLGIYVLQFAAWSGPHGIVYAFEPNPNAAKVLRRHVAMNGLCSRVTVVEVALGSHPGTAVFCATATDGMSRLGKPNALLQSNFEEVDVRVDTIDAFCTGRYLTPNHIMMDVEGYELSVLMGATETLKWSAPISLVVEMHPSLWHELGQNSEHAKGVIDRLGYNVLSLTGQLDPLGDYGHVALVHSACQ